MIFSSPIFLFCFLPFSFLLYRVSKNDRYKNILLCVLSVLFYAFGQIKFLPLFLGSIVINYISGLLLSDKYKSNKLILIITVGINILILCIFKYLSELNVAGIALPLGISFFTFQGMSYVIDTYKDPELGTKDFIKVMLYISFFPRVISGPIVKYHEIVDQLEIREINEDNTSEGIRRFIFGFAKKSLICDAMAKIANSIFNNGTSDFRVAWLGAICYMLQLYYDFSGYSDMAIGIGMMFGFEFPENFRHPYASFSIKEFWRRWHISLSSWFKDYVYIPLGGNRKGKIRTTLNKFLVFILTGLWHGANLTYIVWGIGNGIFATAEDYNIVPVKRLEKTVIGKVVLKIYTILVVMLLMVIFRSESLGAAFSMIGTMFTGGISDNYTLLSLLRPLPIVTLVFAIALAGQLPEKIKLNNKIIASVITIFLFVLSVMAMAKGNFEPFIYAQF